MTPRPDQIAVISSDSFAPSIPREVVRGKLFVGPTSFMESFVSCEVQQSSAAKVRRVLCVCCTPDLSHDEMSRMRSDVERLGVSSEENTSISVSTYFCPIPTSLACITVMEDLVKQLQTRYMRSIAQDDKRGQEDAHSRNSNGSSSGGGGGTGNRCATSSSNSTSNSNGKNSARGVRRVEWGQNSLLSHTVRTTLNQLDSALFPIGAGDEEQVESVAYLHCTNGKHESAALALLYLMVHRQVDFSEGLSVIPGLMMEPSLLLDLADASMSRVILQETCQWNATTTPIQASDETMKSQASHSADGALPASSFLSNGNSSTSSQSYVGTPCSEASLYVLQWLQLMFPMLPALNVEVALIRAQLPDTQQESLRSLLADFEKYMREDEYTILGSVFIRSAKQTLSSMSSNELIVMSALRELTRAARNTSATDDDLRACAERLRRGVDEDWYTCLEYFRLGQSEAVQAKHSPPQSSIISPVASGAGGASTSETGVDPSIFSLPDSLSPTPRHHVGINVALREGGLRTSFDKPFQMPSRDSVDAGSIPAGPEQTPGRVPTAAAPTVPSLFTPERLFQSFPEGTVIPPLALGKLASVTPREGIEASVTALSVSLASTSSLPIVHIPQRTLPPGPLRYRSFDRAMQAIRQGNGGCNGSAPMKPSAVASVPKEAVAPSANDAESLDAQGLLSDGDTSNGSFALGSSQRRVRFALPPGSKAGEKKQLTPRSIFRNGSGPASPRPQMPQKPAVDGNETPVKHEKQVIRSEQEPEEVVEAAEPEKKAPQAITAPSSLKPPEPEKDEKLVVKEVGASNATSTSSTGDAVSLGPQSPSCESEIRTKILTRVAQQEMEERRAAVLAERRKQRMAAVERFLSSSAGKKAEDITLSPSSAHTPKGHSPSAQRSAVKAATPSLSSESASLDGRRIPQSLSPSPARSSTRQDTPTSSTREQVPPLSAASLTPPSVGRKSASFPLSRASEKAALDVNPYTIANASFHALQRAAEEMSSSRAGSLLLPSSIAEDQQRYPQLLQLNSQSTGSSSSYPLSVDPPLEYSVRCSLPVETDDTMENSHLRREDPESNGLAASMSFSPKRTSKRILEGPASLGTASGGGSTAGGVTNCSIQWFPHANNNLSMSVASLNGGRYARYGQSTDFGESFAMENDELAESGVCGEDICDDDDDEDTNLSGTFSSFGRRPRSSTQLNTPTPSLSANQARTGTTADYFRDKKAAENSTTNTLEQRTALQQQQFGIESSSRNCSDETEPLCNTINPTKLSTPEAVISRQHRSNPNPIVTERAEKTITSLYNTVASPHVSREEVAAEYAKQGGNDASVLVTMMQLHRVRAGIPSAAGLSALRERIVAQRSGSMSSSSEDHRPVARLDLTAKPIKSALKKPSHPLVVGAGARAPVRPSTHPPGRAMGAQASYPVLMAAPSRFIGKVDSHPTSPQDMKLTRPSTAGSPLKYSAATHQSLSMPSKAGGLSASVSLSRPADSPSPKRNSLLSTMPPTTGPRKLSTHFISKTKPPSSAPSSVTRRESKDKSVDLSAKLGISSPSHTLHKTATSGAVTPRGSVTTPRRRVSGSLAVKKSENPALLGSSASKTKQSASEHSETLLKSASISASASKRTSLSSTGSKTKRLSV